MQIELLNIKNYETYLLKESILFSNACLFASLISLIKCHSNLK